LKYYLNAYINCYDYFNVETMIRTKGLGRALGIVIKRVLRREVSGDADEAPQRQRPTISAHRQREVVPIDEYAQHVDHEQPEEAAVDYVVTNAESFLGEPHDTSVLMDYVYYVVAKVWNGGVFIFLNK